MAVHEPGASLAHAKHESHSHEAYIPGDDIPQHGVSLPEPKSPLWLPVVGLVLVATALIWWLSTPGTDDADSASKAASSASGDRSAQAAPSPAAPPKPTFTAMPGAKQIPQ